MTELNKISTSQKIIIVFLGTGLHSKIEKKRVQTAIIYTFTEDTTLQFWPGDTMVSTVLAALRTRLSMANMQCGGVPWRLCAAVTCMAEEQERSVLASFLGLIITCSTENWGGAQYENKHKIVFSFWNFDFCPLCDAHVSLCTSPLLFFPYYRWWQGAWDKARSVCSPYNYEEQLRMR